MPHQSFSRVDAGMYAWKYALHYNSAYPNLGHSAGLGEGDCNNFVSQALFAGGWTFVRGPAHARSSWWYDGMPTGSWVEKYLAGYASNTWTSPDAFSDFLASTPRVSRCDESDLNVGDIVQARYVPSDAVIHTMIVTSKRSSDVGVSYHTRDVFNASFNTTTKQKFGADYDYLYWKVADFFTEPIRQTRWR